MESALSVRTVGIEDANSRQGASLGSGRYRGSGLAQSLNRITSLDGNEMTDGEEKVPVTWIHSMHGMPWTVKKMNEAVKSLRPSATIGFAFGGERLPALQEL